MIPLGFRGRQPPAAFRPASPSLARNGAALALSRCLILRRTPFTRQVTAERGHAAEAAGRLVLSGSVLLPPAQTVQHDGDGSPGEPALQQRQATAYPPSGSSIAHTHALPHFSTCPDCVFPLPLPTVGRFLLRLDLGKGLRYMADNHFTRTLPGSASAPHPSINKWPGSDNLGL